MLQSLKERLGLSLKWNNVRKRHWFLAFVCACVAFNFLFSPSSVIANGPEDGIGIAEVEQQHAADVVHSSKVECTLTSPLVCLSQVFLVGARLGISLTMFFLRFFIDLAAYNGFIDAKPVVVGWFLVRDIANMFFIVALLVIAFGTILGLEQYEWKKSLVKLILAAIFINFSRLIAGLIIDVSHVFMVTFTNAIVGSAGSNVVHMFRLDSILSLTAPEQIGGDGSENVHFDLLAAAMMAFIFSATAAAAMFAYTMVLVARVVVLWVLIILSPIAFVLSAIPQGKSYAQEWWSEFSSHVIVGPIIVFFMWLALATMGNADIGQHIGVNYANKGLLDAEGRQILGLSSAPETSIAQIGTWENMSAFIVAIAFLFVGFDRVMKTGVKGTGFISGAQNFAKRVATIATGYAAGRWLAGKGAEGAWKGTKYLGSRIPFVPTWLPGTEEGWKFRSVKQVGRYAKQQIEGVKAWATDTGFRPKVEFDEKTGRYKEMYYDNDEIDQTTGKVLHRKGDVIMEAGQTGKLAPLQKWIHGMVASDVASKKRLEKTEKFAEVRMELLDKRTRGVPSSWLMSKEESVDGLDRMEQGMLEAEKERSAAKTAQLGSVGKMGVLSSVRFQEGELKGDLTMAEIIGRHQGFAKSHKAYIEEELKEGEEAFYRTPEGEDVMRQINAAEIGAKASEAFIAGLKDKELAKEFEKSGEQLKKLIEEGSKRGSQWFKDQIQLRTAPGGGLSQFSRMLGLEQMAKEGKQNSTSILQRQAEDAADDLFVHLPKYGTTAPSTALPDAADAKLKQFQRLDRSAAMQRASNTMAYLLYQKANGQKLDIAQRSELFAASTYLQKEAWNDDQAKYIYQQFEKLQKHELDKPEDAEEKAKWLNMANQFKEIGWLNGVGIKGDQLTGIIKQPNDRRTAASLQNIAITGGDTDIIRAHNAIAERKDKTDKSEADKAVVKYRRANQARASEITSEEIQDVRAKATKISYQQAAGAVLASASFGVIDSVDALKKQYAKYEDFMQEATRDFKNAAVTTGHPQLGYNQDNDEHWGGYRFQTQDEGEDKMFAERVKQKPRNLLSSDQYHGFAEIDLKTGIADKFREKALAVSLGRVTKLIEMVDMPLRSLYALYYLHKTEKTRTHEGNAVVGGQIIKEKIAYEKGVSTNDISNQQLQMHMLKEGILKAVLAGNGGLGWAMGLANAFKHITEQDAFNGDIKIELAGEKIDTMKQLIGKLQEAVNTGLTGTEYEGREEEIRARLKDALNTVEQRRIQMSKQGRGGEGQDNQPPDTSAEDDEFARQNGIIF